MTLLAKIYRKYQNTLTLRAGSWYVVATFVQKGVVFLTVPILVGLLSPAEYGVVAVFSTWLSLFGVVLTLNLPASLNNARFDHDSAQFKQFVSAILFLGGLSVLVGIVVLALLPGDLAGAVFGIPPALVILAAGGALVMFPYQVAMTIWRINLKYVYYTLLNFLTTVYGILLSVGLILVLTVFFPAYDRSLGRMVGLLAPYLFVSALLLPRKLRAGRVLVNRVYWRYALAISLPIMLHSLSGIAMEQFDRLLINQISGRAEAGVYTLAYQFGDIIRMLWMATNSVWFPWFFAQMAQGNRALIRKRAVQYALGFSLITAIVIPVGPLLVRLLAPQQYWQASAVVPVVMTAGYFTLLYSLYANVEFYEKRTGYIAFMTLVSAGVNIVLNLALLPVYGYMVAGWTTLIAYAVLYLGHAAIVITRLKQTDLFPFIGLTLLGVAMTGLTIVVFLLNF